MLLKIIYLVLGFILFSRSVVSSLLPRDDDSSGHPWIDHDKVVPFTQNPSPGLEGQLELRFNPLFYVSGGCDPYPAVDASGNLGAGLQPTNGGRSGCGDGGNGQVYVRRGETQGRTGILYSYYFPKVRGNGGSHRHYWASIVVWIHRWGCKLDDATAIWPVGISFTTDHLNWGIANPGDTSFRASSVGIDMPTHPKMQIHDNAISSFRSADDDRIYERTLISWDSLTESARQALADVKYEKTVVPFTDSNFQAQLDAAFRESLYGGLLDDQGCDKD